MEKLPHYEFSWIVSFQKQIYIYIYICEMLPLDTKQSGDKLRPHSDLRGGSVSRGNIQQQALQQEGREEGTAQLQDWKVERKNFESRRQTGKFEKGNAEE
jgi:hypothetical protein